MTIETIISENEEKEFGEFLHNQIKEFNNRHSPHHLAARQPGAVTPLYLILKDESGNAIGGLSADTHWGWLEVHNFYLPPELRGQGWGASLLHTAEEIARKRGCHSCFLWTFEFQARTFYERQGYEVVGQLKDYPPGSAFYWMRKQLQPASA